MVGWNGDMLANFLTTQMHLRCFNRARICRVVFVVAFFVYGFPANAETLRESLDGLVKNHKRIDAAKMDMSSAKEGIRIARGDWFPTMSFTANRGYERQRKGQDTADTHIPPREVDLSVTQQLWDFGSSNSAIDSSILTFEQMRTTLDATRQAVILEGILAYLNLNSSVKILDYARRSEDNLKHQTEIEDAKVKRGSGLAMDKLQAKAQLAGAMARRVQAEGAMKTSLNRYRSVFGSVPEDLSVLVNPRMPVELLPETVERAIKITEKNNPQLKATRITAEIARENTRQTFADEFMPTINASIDSKWKNDVNGTIGGKQELLMKVEVTKSLNLGLTAINTLRASRQSHMASQSRYGDARNITEEQVRNTWTNLVTAKENTTFLENQANIAAEFLVLARKDLKAGNTDLINVLAGETTLINASSDAEAAKTQVAIAVFSLLGVMGQLEADVIE